MKASPGSAASARRAPAGRLSVLPGRGHRGAQAALRVPVTADCWSGSSWIVNSADNCTTLAAGSVGFDLALNLGSAAADQSCHPSHPVTRGAGRPWLRGRNGSGSAGDDRDPAVRAGFGIFSPESRRTVHVRQIF